MDLKVFNTFFCTNADVESNSAMLDAAFGCLCSFLKKSENESRLYAARSLSRNFRTLSPNLKNYDHFFPNQFRFEIHRFVVYFPFFCLKANTNRFECN